MSHIALPLQVQALPYTIADPSGKYPPRYPDIKRVGDMGSITLLIEPSRATKGMSKMHEGSLAGRGPCDRGLQCHTSTGESITKYAGNCPSSATILSPRQQKDFSYPEGLHRQHVSQIPVLRKRGHARAHSVLQRHIFGAILSE